MDRLLHFETRGYVEFGPRDGAFGVTVGDYTFRVSVNGDGQVSVWGEGYQLRVWLGVDGLRSSGHGVDNIIVDDRRVSANIGGLGLIVAMLVSKQGDVELVTIAANSKKHEVIFDLKVDTKGVERRS